MNIYVTLQQSNLCLKMEQYSQYLMSMKKSNNTIFMNPFPSHSWEEEEALAEDADDQGPLGGFVWPPTSYSCSFCKREFRSAQALGGHMNVHRTERAWLKQTAVNGTISIAPQKQNLCKSLGKETSLGSNSDTKSCVYDGDFLEVSCGNGTDVETNLVLGFGLGSCKNRASGFKRQKTAGAVPLDMEGLDLELRLA